MLLPMAEAAKQAVGSPASLNVIADGGYSNGEQSETCEAQGIVPYVPPKRTAKNHGGGKLFDRTEFVYDEKSDTFRCPAGQTLWRKQFSMKSCLRLPPPNPACPRHSPQHSPRWPRFRPRPSSW
jgi:hypothetical protein